MSSQPSQTSPGAMPQVCRLITCTLAHHHNKWQHGSDKEFTIDTINQKMSLHRGMLIRQTHMGSKTGSEDHVMVQTAQRMRRTATASWSCKQQATTRDRRSRCQPSMLLRWETPAAL